MPKQRALLQPREEPSPAFRQELRASHELSRALGRDRNLGSSSQAALLQNKAKQLAYAEEARQRPRPPLDLVVAQQGFVSDLRRDAADHVVRADHSKHAHREQRLARQGDFLASRQARHEGALEGYERDMDSLAEECQAETQKASERMKGNMDAAVARVDELLDPLEKTTDRLGEKSEEEVRGVLTTIEEVTEERRRNITDFTSELEDIDRRRKRDTTKLLEGLAQALADAAHMVPGEIERIIEEKTLDLDSVLLENQKAVKVLSTKLTVQTLEASKANKLRWHKGLLLWKQKRHVHSIGLVMQRVHSPEFEQPPELVELLDSVRQCQTEVFEGRSTITRAAFQTPLTSLLPGAVRTWEEQNTSLNDRTQDAFDRHFEELKDFRERLQECADKMLDVLARELEAHDARAEWGEHASIAELIDASIRPPLQERMEAIKELIAGVVAAVSKQEESQHHVMTQLLAFFSRLATKGESLKNRLASFESDYQGEIEDCVHDFDEACAASEQKMSNFKEKIEDAAHYEALEELKKQAFDQLNEMEQHYREHSSSVLGIHGRYPEKVDEVVREQTELFCQDLGLALEPPEAEEGVEPTECEEGALVGLKVFERLSRAQLRDLIIADDTAAQEEAGDEAAAAVPEPAAADGEGEGEEDQTHAEDLGPQLRDGTPVLAMLSFDLAWLEESFGTARVTVFTQLASSREYLSRLDISGACEEVRRQLDQRLRRHTNRKGEVQVEWYVPRYAAVSKHKDKFERHLVDVARKSQAHDAEMADLAGQMEAAEQAYQEQLETLRGKLGEAETMPMLTAFERQAGEVASTFVAECQRISARMLSLATKAPQELQKVNEAFLAMCRRGEEGYSQTEIVFYGKEVEEVNRALEKKAQERSARREELEAEIDSKRTGPFETFTESFDEAAEQLCATKGYGKKYGKPRRKAQGLCRTLVAHSATVSQNLSQLLEYLGGLCSQPTEEMVDTSMLPRFPMCMKTERQTFQLRDFFDASTEPWSFSSELLGVLYVVVCTFSVLGTHLQVFKDEHAGKYSLEKVPAIRVLNESEVLCTAETADDVKKVEQDLRAGCMKMALGKLMEAKPFDAEIREIVADAQKDSQETFKGAVPEFMTKFLAEMKDSANRSRQESARGMRELSDRLRDSALLGLGDAAFGELTTRAIAELRSSARRAQAETAAAWAELDAQRADHEQRLSPGLSNPNAEAQLRELIEAESARTERAVETATGDRERMAACLRGACNAYVRRLSATFETAIRLVDTLPLHTHFAALPGDEHAENPRMSIKRRMRHLQNGTNLDQWGDGLPERTWAGLPRYELRARLLGGAWPADEDLSNAAEETLQEQTEGVKSFRSPLHKTLFETRGRFYDRYRAAFQDEVARRDAELIARSEREEVGRRSWQSMVRQLQGDSGSGS